MTESKKLSIFFRCLDSTTSLKSSTSRFSTSDATTRIKKEQPIKFLIEPKETFEGNSEAYSGSAGPNAKLDFYDTFLNLKFFTERNKIQKIEKSPNTSYLEKVQKQKFNSNPFRIVRRKGLNTCINLHEYNKRGIYAETFTSGMNVIKNFETLNLKANQQIDFEVSKMLKNIESKPIKKIVLSENKISPESIKFLNNMLASPDTTVKLLELENVGLSDKSVIALCKILTENKVLTSLNLANNHIGQLSALALSKMLKYNRTIKSLDLY